MSDRNLIRIQGSFCLVLQQDLLFIWGESQGPAKSDFPPITTRLWFSKTPYDWQGLAFKLETGSAKWIGHERVFTSSAVKVNFALDFMFVSLKLTSVGGMVDGGGVWLVGQGLFRKYLDPKTAGQVPGACLYSLEARSLLRSAVDFYPSLWDILIDYSFDPSIVTILLNSLSVECRDIFMTVVSSMWFWRNNHRVIFLCYWRRI